MSLIELLVRSTALLLVGLLVDHLIRRHPIARRNLWTGLFALLILGLIPIPRLEWSILPSPTIEAVAFSSQVPNQLSAREVIYLGDPGWPPLLTTLISLTAFGPLWFVMRLVRTARLVRAADQVTQKETLNILLELSHHAGLSDVPLLKQSDEITSPMTVGVLHPCILLPCNGNHDLIELKLTLLHEVLHIQNKDCLRILMMELVRYSFWWHPLVQVCYRRAVLSLEQSVDRAIGSSTSYTALLKSHVEPRQASGMVNFRGLGHMLTRLRALDEPRVAQRWHPNWVLMVLFPLALPLELVPAYDPSPEQVGHNEVLFQAVSDKGSHLKRMASDGRLPSPMPSIFNNIGGPSLSPDGKWLAYTRLHDGQEDIYVAPITGTSEQQLVSTPKRDVQPRWSPDGRALVFCTLQTGTWEIGCYDFKEHSYRLLTNDGLKNLEPSWHPSGKSIVFSSHRSGAQKIWHLDLPTSKLTQLTFGDWEDTHARVSPDGGSMVFSSNRRQKYEATLLDLNSFEVQPLVPLQQLDTGEVEFVEHGKAVVMTSWDGTEPSIGKVDLQDLSFRRLSGSKPGLWPVSR